MYISYFSIKIVYCYAHYVFVLLEMIVKSVIHCKVCDLQINKEWKEKKEEQNC